MSHLEKQFALDVDERELATILAALRIYQDEYFQINPEIPNQAIQDIATDCGALKPLVYSEVNQLCERINAGPQVSSDKRRKVWLLAVMDRDIVVYTRTYYGRDDAEKALLDYLQNYQGYNGQDNVAEACDWLAGEGGTLSAGIFSTSAKDMRCNWCEKETDREGIRWKGLLFCSDACLDACRAAQ